MSLRVPCSASVLACSFVVGLLDLALAVSVLHSASSHSFLFVLLQLIDSHQIPIRRDSACISVSTFVPCSLPWACLH
jgi:hypothetical protein